MGIIKSAVHSAGSMAGDQWKEFFYCDAIPADTIMVRGFKRDTERSVNQGNDEVITDGSIIAVADGEFALVVSGGKAVAEYKEPGEHVFSSGQTVSIFSGATLSSIGKEFGRRVAFGGDAPPVTQRVYYFNTKEMKGEEFEGEGIPFRILDENSGLDVDCSLKVTGYYTFRVVNPMVVYKQLIGNVSHVYKSEYLLKMMSAEVKNVILTAFGEIAATGLRPSQIGTWIPEVMDKAKEIANRKLYDLRGIELYSFSIMSFRLTDKDGALIKDFQSAAALQDPSLAAGSITNATGRAMQSAANNTAGAMMGVAAVNAASPAPQAPEAATASPKFCTQCGAKLMGGKFCPECGQPI